MQRRPIITTGSSLGRGVHHNPPAKKILIGSNGNSPDDVYALVQRTFAEASALVARDDRAGYDRLVVKDRLGILIVPTRIAIVRGRLEYHDPAGGRSMDTDPGIAHIFAGRCNLCKKLFLAMHHIDPQSLKTDPTFTRLVFQLSQGSFLLDFWDNDPDGPIIGINPLCDPCLAQLAEQEEPAPDPAPSSSGPGAENDPPIRSLSRGLGRPLSN
jgi:hypothetical protein